MSLSVWLNAYSSTYCGKEICIIVSKAFLLIILFRQDTRLNSGSFTRAEGKGLLIEPDLLRGLTAEDIDLASQLRFIFQYADNIRTAGIHSGNDTVAVHLSDRSVIRNKETSHGAFRKSKPVALTREKINNIS